MQFLFLCSDICSAFGAQVHPYLEKQAINELLQEGRRSKTHKTKQVATWATKELRKLKQQQVSLYRNLISSKCSSLNLHSSLSFDHPLVRLCRKPLNNNRLMNSKRWLDESSSLLMPRMTPVRLCHMPLSHNRLMNSSCWLNESSSLLVRAPYYSSVPVLCAAGRQQAHEFELLTGGMFLSIMTRVVAFHVSLSRSAKPKHTQLSLTTSALCDLRMSR